jgi:segregation and condensation protein B
MGVTVWSSSKLGKRLRFVENKAMLEHLLRFAEHSWSAARLPRNHALPLRHRLWLHEDEAAATASPAEAVRDSQLSLVEAALVATDEPLTLRRLAGIAGITDLAEVRRLVRKLKSFYERDGSAFQIAEVAGGVQLFTRPQFHAWIGRVRRGSGEFRLSQAARETLAIVAYRQPIMRADVEAIRGVQCGEMLRQLMEKGLVRITGRHDSLGRPVLYGTTRKFLQIFGFNSLKDLPGSREQESGAREQEIDSPGP